VAPTLRVAVPPVSVPVVEGLLVNVPTVMLLAPDVMVIGEVGNEMEKVYVERPVMVNEAAAIVPATTGNVTPPVDVLVPAGASTTVPPVPLTATFPKFMSTVFEMAMGVIIVADAVAVAETWANELIDKLNIKNRPTVSTFKIFFICLLNFCISCN